MMGYFYISLMVLLTTAGQLLTKKGAGKLSLQGGFPAGILEWFNRYLLLALVTVGAAPIFYILALRELELSVAFAFTGVNYILVSLGGKLIFGERLNKFHYTGIALIFIGISIFNL